MTKVEIGDVIFWELCVAIGLCAGISIWYPVAGVVLGAVLLVFAVYIQWVGSQD